MVKTPKGGESVYHTSGIPFIRSQNVIDNSLILDHTCIPEEMHESMKSSKVLAGDILLNITGGSIGRSCVVPTNFKEGNVNQHVSIIRLKKDNPNFLQSILSSWRGQKLIFEGQTGSGREGLNFESIKGFKVSFPTVSEQQKIASFLSLLSERIKTQIKIIEELQSQKNSLSKKLLSCQVRFLEHIEKWKEVKIGDVVKIGSGKDYKHLAEGEVPVFGTGGYMTSVDSCLYEGETVCIGRKGTIDKPFYYNGKIWTVDTLFFTHSYKSILPRFLFYVFEQINWLKFNEASGVPSLSKSTIEKIAIKIPSVKEQQKITTTLFAIDQKIDLESKHLELLKQQKRYFLQNLFI